jgi:hypothetical protein
MWCKEAQPIRDESFPYLPSKPISDVKKTAVFTFIAFISELKYNNIVLYVSREMHRTKLPCFPVDNARVIYTSKVQNS